MLSGRIHRSALDRALDVGYEVQDFRTYATESTAFIIRTDRATLTVQEQAQRLHAAGYLCVHVNPRLPDVRTIVTGTLTYEPGFEDVSPPE